MAVTDLPLLLRTRRSGSTFAKLSQASVEALLAYSLSTLAVSVTDTERELRRVPSAGALHPLHLLLSEGESWHVYLARSHVLREVHVDDVAGKALWEEITRAQNPAAGTLLLVLGEIGVLAARYDNPETLFLREAGCLLGYLGLIAEAMNLSYRMLGPTGDPWARNLVLGAAGLFMGVGTALVGGR